jgi:hypothetical protein
VYTCTKKACVTLSVHKTNPVHMHYSIGAPMMMAQRHRCDYVSIFANHTYPIDPRVANRPCTRAATCIHGCRRQRVRPSIHGTVYAMYAAMGAWPL